MQFEANVIIGIMGLILCVATFYVGRQTSAKSEGKIEGSLQTDIKYIKESIDRIENNLSDNIIRLENRINEINTRLTVASGDVSKALENAKCAHKRIDGLLADCWQKD